MGATNGNTSELMTVDDESGSVTSVKWAPDGRYISVGLNSPDVHLWDSVANRLNIDRTSISSWSNGLEQPHFDNRRNGWKDSSGQQLANGGNDNLLHIWDRCMASANAPTQQRGNIEDALEKLQAIIDAASYVPPPP
ncbi:cell division cycle 20.2, cofactor of APC complex-like protein [Tanacetum coccineum]